MVNHIYFGGSRSLPPSPLLAQVVGAVLASGSRVHVGCSAGADAQVIACAHRSASFPQVQVFSAFGRGGVGGCGASAVSAVQSWAQAGGSVSWLAGGALVVPLAARLIRRSLAGLAGASAAVFFWPGSGSLAVASYAVAAGIPVFAFGGQPAPINRAAGCWVSSSFAGLPCWQWVTAQMSLF